MESLNTLFSWKGEQTEKKAGLCVVYVVCVCTRACVHGGLRSDKSKEEINNFILMIRSRNTY